MKSASEREREGAFLEEHFEEIVSVVEPLVKEVYPGNDSARTRQEISLLLLAVIQTVTEQDPHYLLNTLENGFMSWISKGVYLDQLERVAGRVSRALSTHFGENPLVELQAIIEGRELFFRVVKAYTGAFREFSERQLRQLEILNLLGDFTREDLKKLFAKVFRKTMTALGAQYGVLYYSDPSLEIFHKRLKNTDVALSRFQLKRFMADKGFDPAIVGVFGQLLESGGMEGIPGAGPRRNGRAIEPSCALCREEATLATKFSGRTECMLLEGVKVNSLICVPFKRGGVNKGKFLLARAGPPAFSRNDLEFLKALTADISRGVDNYFLYNELRELATVDSLTGLSNRRHLMDSLRKEHERARRYDKQYAVIMADLDHFKSINDNYGHAAGDEVLRVFGNLLMENSRLTDIIGRYGGEEFLIVIPENSVESAAQFAERLRGLLDGESVPLPDGREICVSASFGVCGYPKHGRTVEAMLRKVDDFLYRAKEKGRNRVEVAP
ncbi:MAG: sensor domain-containing diguanylate cyclase [bacterium]